MRACGLECEKPCPYEGNDLSWVQRRGGCPFNYTPEPLTAQEKRRVGQQRGKRGKKEERWSYHVPKKVKRYGR